MQTVSELLELQRRKVSGDKNKDVWGDILYNVKEYGAKGDGAKDDTKAIQDALNDIKDAGGGVLLLPPGIYITSYPLNISGINNLTVAGSGVDVSIIRTKSTSDVFYSSTASRWRTFRDFTIDSSVTQSSASHFNFTAQEARLVIEDVKLKGWFNGIKLDSYEVCWLNRVSLTEPTGAGAAIIAGKVAGAAQGANLTIRDCFIRGSNGTDGVTGTVIGDVGVQIYDADAVFMFNTDIGEVVTSDVRIEPSTRCANVHFDTCYLDTTKNGPCLFIGGAGVKLEHSYDNVWIASGGQVTGGANNVPGIHLTGSGAVRGVAFTGGRVFNCTGIGVKYEFADTTVIFDGMNIEFNGLGGVAGQNYGFYINSALNGQSAKITDCNFYSNNGQDIYTESQTTKYIITDCLFEKSITHNGKPERIESNDSLSVTDVIASASTITLPGHGGELFTISGTTNILSITPTWRGHRITLFFQDVLTVADDNLNLRMPSNFVTSSNDTLTMICDGAEWIEVCRSAN